jgi:carboxylesterase
VEELAEVGWRDWIREVVTAGYDFLEQGKRLHLVGLSMGGAICLLAAPVLGAASLSTINASVKVYSRRMWMAPLLRGSNRVLEEDPRVPPDEEALPYFQQYDGNPIGSSADLQDLMRAARRNLATITCPALVIQSLRDETVRPESGRIIYSGISSADKTLLWLERSRHNALVDAERDLIHDAVMGRISHAR